MIEIFFDVSALCAFKGLQRNCILQDSYDWLCERLGVLSLSNFYKLKFKISDYHFFWLLDPCNDKAIKTNNPF